MTATLLRFYVHENRKHRHRLLYEWLLEEARKLGVPGGSAFRSIAGYGRHGVLHEEHFFELAGDLPVVIEFAVSDAQADALFALFARESIDILFVRMPIEIGRIAGGARDA